MKLVGSGSLSSSRSFVLATRPNSTQRARAPSLGRPPPRGVEPSAAEAHNPARALTPVPRGLTFAPQVACGGRAPPPFARCSPTQRRAAAPLARADIDLEVRRRRAEALRLLAQILLAAEVGTADLRWIDPPQKIGFRTKPSICGFFLLLRNIFT